MREEPERTFWSNLDGSTDQRKNVRESPERRGTALKVELLFHVWSRFAFEDVS